jgi:hypothetical protein
MKDFCLRARVRESHSFPPSRSFSTVRAEGDTSGSLGRRFLRLLFREETLGLVAMLLGRAGVESEAETTEDPSDSSSLSTEPSILFTPQKPFL